MRVFLDFWRAFSAPYHDLFFVAALSAVMQLLLNSRCFPMAFSIITDMRGGAVGHHMYKDDVVRGVPSALLTFF